ncbi:MAG: hypothetical protein K6F71_09475 [Ruminococcus sp.]|uniref:hypothetical protein n=1 Tax=Ruminococcus sp. TaxID=41978 RepID=UPI0025F07E47|nr:hypothetical protein [Ruminococcus sp.]MCR5541027.1 hypothetical protein [Ruminococcus sp.]
MKRINTVAFITALVVCLAGCGNKSKDDTKSKAENSAAESSADAVVTADETEVTAEEDIQEDVEQPSCRMTVTTYTNGEESFSEDYEVKYGDVFFEDAEGRWYLNENEELEISADTEQPVANIFSILDDGVTVNSVETVAFDDTRDIASTFEVADGLNYSHQMIFSDGGDDKSVCKMKVTTAYSGVDADGNELESGTFSEDFEVKSGDVFFEDVEGHWYIPEMTETRECILRDDLDVPIIEVKEVGDGWVNVNLVETVNFGVSRDVASNVTQGDTKFSYKALFAKKE